MTLFVSTVGISRAAHRALKITDLYSLHRIVVDIFGARERASITDETPSARILFASQPANEFMKRLLVFSPRSPREDYCTAGLELETKHLPESYFSHKTYRFQSCINPAIRHPDHNVIPIRGKDRVAAWFAERATRQWGFRVHPNTMSISSLDVQEFKAHSQNITISQATVSGMLTVTDSSAFRRSIYLGIGRARAFGCGLLQAIPVNSHHQEGSLHDHT